MKNAVANPCSNLLLAILVVANFASSGYCQFQLTELSPFSTPGKSSQANAITHVVQWKDTHVIVAFESSLRRYSLVARKEEGQGFDLLKIPTLKDPRNIASGLNASDSGNAFVLFLANNDPAAGSNCYLFDKTAWTCDGEIESIANWFTSDLDFGQGPKILEESGLIVIPRFLGRRSVLEIRRLESASNVIQHVPIADKLCACWWDDQHGLIVLSGENRQSHEKKLLQIDVETGRVTKTSKWQLPFKTPFHRMQETASLLMHNGYPSRHENYSVTFGKPPRRLLSKMPPDRLSRMPMFSYHCTPSPNRRYLVARYSPQGTQSYILDLAESREVAVFEAAQELPVAITNDGRFYLSVKSSHKDGKDIEKLILRDFAGEAADPPQVDVSTEN